MQHHSRGPRRGSLFLPWAALAVLAACPASSPAPVPPAGPDPQVEPLPRPDPAPPPVHDAGAGPASGSLQAGEPCLEAAACASGVCEGQGCSSDQPGRCAAEMRACTRDLRPYCGCDGQTFRTSGSCPGRRFAYRGECEEPRAVGEGCFSGAGCASGVCEGQGCGPDEPGVCVEVDRRCTADLASFCGCDGESFASSSSCPGRRYEARRACEEVSE